MNNIMEHTSGKMYISQQGGVMEEITSKSLLQDNLKTKYFHAIDVNEGIVQGMIEDNQGRIWVIRESSIDCVNPKTGQCNVFGPNDFDFYMSFSQSRPYHDPASNNISVGTPLGLITFNPATLKKSNYQPKVIFSSLHYSGEKESEPILHKEKVVIPANKRNLTITFASLDYQRKYQTRYLYRIDGYTAPGEWISNGSSNVIGFNRISHGDYVLKVRATNSQVMSQALMDAIIKTGSDVKLNCGINKIIVENGKAIGAIDQNGEEYRAKVVVSNVSPTVTYNNLIDEDKVPKEVIPYFKNYDVGISALTCFIALDCPPEEVGFKDSFNLTYSSLNANRDFKNAYCLDTTIDPIVSTCYTVDDNDGYPAGTSVLTAGTLKFSDAWEKLSPEEYYDAKYAAANTIVDRLEKLYPNLRDHIEEIEIATPITHMRYLHHPGGAIYGYEQNLKSSVFFFPQEMFIDNLYFASGWVNTCGFGPNYMYGNKIANRILKEMK
jgi:hypothetical protein